MVPIEGIDLAMRKLGRCGLRVMRLGTGTSSRPARSPKSSQMVSRLRVGACGGDRNLDDAALSPRPVRLTDPPTTVPPSFRRMTCTPTRTRVPPSGVLSSARVPLVKRRRDGRGLTAVISQAIASSLAVVAMGVGVA
jgi:hypothetical protein